MFEHIKHGILCTGGNSIELWVGGLGSVGVAILNKLQVAQKYIIKIMLFKNKTFYTELLLK